MRCVTRNANRSNPESTATSSDEGSRTCNWSVPEEAGDWDASRDERDAALPPDVRKASGFPVAVSLKSCKRLRLMMRGVASLNQNPSLAGKAKPSAHQAAQPLTDKTQRSLSRLFDRKVSRFRMMNNNRRCRLLGIELEFFSQLNVNSRGMQQLKQLYLIFQV